MSYLLDTNVVSEWTKERPNTGTIKWLAQVDEDRVFLSVVTLAELRKGIHRLPESHRRKRLHEWLQGELLLRFESRILSIDSAIADEWGVMVASAEKQGRSVGAMDGFIAATARVHSLVLVTRNASDFEPLLPEIVNPWSGGS